MVSRPALGLPVTALFSLSPAYGRSAETTNPAMADRRPWYREPFKWGSKLSLCLHVFVIPDYMSLEECIRMLHSHLPWGHRLTLWGPVAVIMFFYSQPHATHKVRQGFSVTC